jgi:hypothetical protein
LLNAASGSAREYGERYLDWRIHESLGKLYFETNRVSEGEHGLDQARQQVKALASSVPDKELKDAFLRRAYNMLATPT